MSWDYSQENNDLHDGSMNYCKQTLQAPAETKNSKKKFLEHINIMKHVCLFSWPSTYPTMFNWNTIIAVSWKKPFCNIQLVELVSLSFPQSLTAVHLINRATNSYIKVHFQIFFKASWISGFDNWWAQKKLKKRAAGLAKSCKATFLHSTWHLTAYANKVEMFLPLQSERNPTI